MGKRVWPRFRLRTLLLAVTAICLWLGWRAECARTERVLISRIMELGGSVAYDVDFDQRTYERYPTKATSLAVQARKGAQSVFQAIY